MRRFDPHIKVKPDGLLIPLVRQWCLTKYKLVGSYCDIFTSGMSNKWNQLVYIDLFAGSGYSKIKETGEVYLNSALLAMSIPNPFTKYVLCERDDERFEALSKRVRRDFSHLDCELIHGDSNENVLRIKESIPKFQKGNTLLSFCFVDPYSLDLSFETIRSLGNQLMDFLILQALHMDANRNLESYMREKNNKIANYLGIDEWRELFEREVKQLGNNFVKFLADQYQKQMENLGYKKSINMHQIRSNEKNLPLYYLSFYSKSSRGVDFFRKVRKRVSSQESFNF